MTDFDLDALDKLNEAATPVPWNSHATDDDYFMNARFIGTRPSDGWHDDGNGLAVGFPDQEPPENVIAITLLQHPRLADNEKCDDNMDLIVALRNAYPAMSAELRRLRAENERYREALETTLVVMDGPTCRTDWRILERQIRRALEEGEE